MSISCSATGSSKLFCPGTGGVTSSVPATVPLLDPLKPLYTSYPLHSPCVPRAALVNRAARPAHGHITPSAPPAGTSGPCAAACSHRKPPPGTRHHQVGVPAWAPSGDAAKLGRGVGVGMAGAAKGAAASSPVQVGMPCGWGAPGPSPVMPVPGAHTPSFQLRYRVPQAQLSLAHAGEARGEDMTLAREDGPHGPHSLVGRKPLLGGGGDRERRHPAACLGELGGTSDRLADFGGGEPGRWDEGAGDRRGPNYSASSGGPRLAPRPGGSGRRAPLGRSRPSGALGGGALEQGKSAGSPGSRRGFSRSGAPRAASAFSRTGRGLGGRSWSPRGSERARPARPGLPGPRARVAAHSSC